MSGNMEPSASMTTDHIKLDTPTPPVTLTLTLTPAAPPAPAPTETVTIWSIMDFALFSVVFLILTSVLGLISQVAWTGSVQLGQGTFFPALGTGLLGAVVNPSDTTSAPKQPKLGLSGFKDAAWRALVLLATAACVATGWAVWDHRSDSTYSTSYSVPALVASLSALAGVYANLASITRRPS